MDTEDAAGWYFAFGALTADRIDGPGIAAGNTGLDVFCNPPCDFHADARAAVVVLGIVDNPVLFPTGSKDDGITCLKVIACHALLFQRGFDVGHGNHFAGFHGFDAPGGRDV